MANSNHKTKKLHILPESIWLVILMVAVLLSEIVFILFLAVVDMLPMKYIIAVLALIVALDIAGFLLMSSRADSNIRRNIGSIICVLTLIVMAGGSYYLGSTYDTLAKITNQYTGEQTRVTSEPFNVLVSGIDSRDDISDDYARSDVNMIITVNPQTYTILLTSMPRDSYVPLHMNGEMDKLTHTGVYGIEETIGTIEDWLDVDIDYYVRVDFHMLVNLVNAVHGITVNNNIDFYSSVKGWHYKKGEISLTGKQALWFVRERKAFEDEDEQRIRNQQKVMKALITKMTSKKTLLLNYTNILNAVEDNMQTDMSRREMSSLVKLQLQLMPEWKIKRQWVDGDDDYRGTWSMGPGRELFVSIPKEESVEQVKQGIQQVLSGETEETEKKQ